jgi:ketosteroid isomerase-like protein
MKQLLTPILLFLSITVFAQNKDEQQILSILDAQNKAWNAGNIDVFMKSYWQSDSLMFIGSSGITYGYDATLKNYYKRYPDRDAMGQLTFTILKLNPISGDSYFVIGKWFLKREKNGDMGGHFTLLWKKINGEWVIVTDHSS